MRFILHRLQLLFFGCFLTILLAEAGQQAASKPKQQPVCSNAGGFKFTANPPARRELTFCREFSQSTCCDERTIQEITRAAAPYFGEKNNDMHVFSDSCRRASSSILCFPCHPAVGTQLKRGVCLVQLLFVLI